jgi:hypothetical protein
VALGIDVNTLRPAQPHQPSPMGLQTNPIGLLSRAIGLQKEGQKHQALSCVGLHQHTTPATATKAAPDAVAEPAVQPSAIDSLAALWTAVGCRSVSVVPTDAERERLHQLAIDRTTKASQTTPERMKAARDAEARAKAKHAPVTGSVPCAVAGAAHHPHADGLTREHDEHAHDLSAWDD